MDEPANQPEATNGEDQAPVAYTRDPCRTAWSNKFKKDSTAVLELEKEDYVYSVLVW
jgi:hypothetical protein